MALEEEDALLSSQLVMNGNAWSASRKQTELRTTMMALREVAGAHNTVSETKEMLAGKQSICSSTQDAVSTCRETVSAQTK